MIDGVKVTPLKAIPDERGRLMELFKSIEPDFEKFGQVYLTTAYPGAVKAWHFHKKQTDNFICIQGMMKVVLHDSREGSPTAARRTSSSWASGTRSACGFPWASTTASSASRPARP